MGQNTSRPGRNSVLETLLLLYWGASFLHLQHNTEFMGAYPNLPTSILRSGIYWTWVAITAIGVIGHFLNRQGCRLTGSLLLCIYASVGLNGLIQYTRVPISENSQGMNFTIWFEVVIATVLLGCLTIRAKRLTAR